MVQLQCMAESDWKQVRMNVDLHKKMLNFLRKHPALGNQVNYVSNLVRKDLDQRQKEWGK